MSECQSCKEERQTKGLPPMEMIELPKDVTPKKSFRKPNEPTVVCPYCDGETLVSTALRNHEERQAK